MKLSKIKQVIQATVNVVVFYHHTIGYPMLSTSADYQLIPNESVMTLRY